MELFRSKSPLVPPAPPVGSSHLALTTRPDQAGVRFLPRTTLLVHSLLVEMSLAFPLRRGGFGSPRSSRAKREVSLQREGLLLASHLLDCSPSASFLGTRSLWRPWGRCCLAARQGMLEACIDGTAEGTGLFATKPLVEVSRTMWSVIGGSDRESEQNLRRKVGRGCQTVAVKPWLSLGRQHVGQTIKNNTSHGLI